MRDLHGFWFWVTAISTGSVGVWGVTLALMKQQPGRLFAVGRTVAITTALIQVGLGLLLLRQLTADFEGYQAPGFHVFYGVVIAITLSIVYVYRATMAQRPALTYGLMLLFVMGLGIRAYTNVL